MVNVVKCWQILVDIGRYCQMLADKRDLSASLEMTTVSYNQGMTQIAVGSQIWNYSEVGPAAAKARAGEVILILHGWGRTGAEWLAMARELDCRAYVVDLPGFGGSTLPEVKDIFEYSELVEKFCKYMKIEKAVVLGHSLGGRVGIVMASKSPTLVEKLILIDPAGVKPRSLKRAGLKLVARLFSWVPTRIRRIIIEPFMDEDYRNTPSRSAYSTAVAGGPALRGLYRAVVGEDLRNYLPKIKCKTWVIWGEKDQILPLSLTDIYKKLLPYPIVRVIWGAGHDPHLSHYLPLKRVLEEALWI